MQGYPANAADGKSPTVPSLLHETDDTGERTFYYWRTQRQRNSGWCFVRPGNICKALATFDYLYLSGIVFAI